MNATFVMSSTHLYILCEWEDNTTIPEDYVTDAVLFCWNMDVVNFSAYFPTGMSTAHMGGGRVDSWKWHHHTTVSSGIPSLCIDDCFEDDGKLIFIVAEGQIGKAIGKGSSNVRKLEEKLKKKVRIVEHSSDLHKFIQNIVYPSRLENIEEDGKTVILTAVDTKTRGYLIGRNASNLRNSERILKRHFDVDELKVR